MEYTFNYLTSYGYGENGDASCDIDLSHNEVSSIVRAINRHGGDMSSDDLYKELPDIYMSIYDRINDYQTEMFLLYHDPLDYGVVFMSDPEEAPEEYEKEVRAWRFADDFSLDFSIPEELFSLAEEQASIGRRELMRLFLESVKDMAFSYDIFAYEGGTCGQGWNTRENVDFSREELLCLISERIGDPSVFEGLQLDAMDLEGYIDDLSHDLAWPDGGPEASVNSCIPLELEDLEKEIGNADPSDDESTVRIMRRIAGIGDGEYTFRFSVYDGPGYYCFTEDAECTLELKADEVKGLFRHECDKFRFYDREKYPDLGEFFLLDRSKDSFSPSDYDYFSYGGNCGAMDNYLEAWQRIWEMVVCDSLTGNDKDMVHDYFNDKVYESITFDAWWDDME